ncbi:hypothetical protein IMSAGC004_01689 [Bacteroidaceae bacterium]|nr:hypothetical protein IMSAGC004_01689 [Bacteroidaceae bacterium]
MFHFVNHAFDAPGTLHLVFFLPFAVVAVVDNEALAQILALHRREAVEPIEISVVILRDDLFYQTLLRLCDRALRTFPDEQHEILEETGFLHVHLLAVDAERVHRDRLLFRVADVLAVQVLAKSLVAVSRIDHHHVRSLLVKLAHDGVHVEALAAARRPQAEKIGVVGQFVLSLLSRDINSHGHALTVGVVDFQRRLLAVLYAFLVHQAHGGVTQRQKTVILFVHAIAVARERTDEQLQLVVGVLADMDAHAPKSVFQMVRAFLQVGVGRYGDNQVEVGVHELTTLTGDDLLHPLDVLDGHLVARVRDARVPVFLFIQHGQLTLLAGQVNDLVIYHRLRVRDAVDNRHEVHRHFRIVDFDIGIGTDLRGQCGVVHVHKAVHLAAFVTHGDRLLVRLEVGHRHDAVLEVHGEIAVHILACFFLVQELHLHTAVTQLVVYLAYLHKEVAPLLAVIREQAALLRLLRDSQVTHAVRVVASLEIAEVGR